LRADAACLLPLERFTVAAFGAGETARATAVAFWAAAGAAGMAAAAATTLASGLSGSE
jgi:hypothetical protein